MADAVDMANEIEAEHLAAGLRRTLVPLDPGTPGECTECGEIMPRLIGGRCGFCRDGRMPPPNWTPPAMPAPIAKEPVIMAESKSITFVATGAVLAEIKRRTADGTSNNRAALDLVEAAIAGTIEQPAALPEFNLGMASVPELLSELQLRITQAASSTADLDAARQRAEAAEARATSAEAARDDANGKLARLREALA
jgi:hypothetical protein